MKTLMTLAGACAALLAGQAFATDGAYVGVQGGLTNGHLKQLGTVSGGNVATKSKGMNGGEGGVYAGYGQTYNGIYVGGEAEATDGRVSRKDTLNGTAMKTEKTYGYGVSGRLGYDVGNGLMPYAKLGYGWAHFQQKDPAIGMKDSHTAGGMTTGLGVEYALNQQLSLRGEWDGARYGSFKGTAGANHVTDKARDDQFRIGLSYHF